MKGKGPVRRGGQKSAREAPVNLRRNGLLINLWGSLIFSLVGPYNEPLRPKTQRLLVQDGAVALEPV